MGDNTSYGFYSINHKMSSVDGSHSSDSESLKGDMSYLFGRDPSILAYGQRPYPSQDSKKNLISLLEEKNEEDESIECEEVKVSTNTTDSAATQTVKVYLRLKPFPRKIVITPEQAEAYTIVNSTTLLTKLPSLDTNASYLKKVKTSDKVCRTFTFTKTFGPEAPQLELFEQAVKPQMVEFLAGKNSVIMSYGTTNSGKTYTLQGNAKFPGIIPRGLEYVFGNINPRSTPPYKPVNLCDIICLNHHDRLQENDQKVKLLGFFNQVDKTSYVNTYEQIQQQLHQESPVRPSQNFDSHYSVWISFAEIYNENIYDLLSNDCQKKRPALKLACDSRGRAFIKGLKSVSVNSGAEAYQVLMAGQYNLKVAATALNSRSSRSHCIFIIKLLKYRNENDPHSVVVSTFTFCDLAGSERLKKTLNVGERLKEAQNINTSLLVLGRCLKTIYETQNSVKTKNESIGPFRESKLTKLFQRALSGKEQIALIVNVNPLPNLYDETQNVLNFSAIAKKIEIERYVPAKRRRSNTRFSRLVTQSMKTEMDWENTELDDDISKESEEDVDDCELEENDDEALEDLLAENEMLKKEVKELKASALAKEMQTRKEMSDMYSDIMKKIETDWKNRLDNMEEEQEDLRELAIERVEFYYKEKLSQLKLRKRSRSSRSLECEDEDDDDDKDVIEETEAENARLLAKIYTMEKTIKDLKEKKEAAESEKTKISFELVVAQQESKRVNEMLSIAEKSIANDDASGNYIEELKEILKQKEERIKTMKVFLNEAKEEYISITNYAETMENRLKQQDEQMVEYTERLRDLEEQLTQSNVYFSEQSKLIENLEEELEQKTKKLFTAEEKIKNLTEQSNALDSSKSDKSEKEPNEEGTNEELVRANLLLEEMKLKFQFADEENKLLKQNLNQRVNEIDELKSNLDSTKDQLGKITEKINSLNIDEKEENEKLAVVTAEQEIQTDTVNKSLANESETKSIANTSCQTIEVQSPTVETDEKGLQTSLCLISPVKHIKKETIELEVFNELQKDYEEIKQTLEMCKIEKEEAEKDFERKNETLKAEINALILREEEKNERIECLQKELKEVVKNFEEEKINLQSLIDAQESKDQHLVDQMTTILIREKDKDNEIFTLQKEMKTLIQTHEETAKRMETEMKVSLRELTVTKEQLVKVEEKGKKVEKEYMQVIHILERKIDASEQKMLEKQTENDRLKFKVEELKKSLADVHLELESYTKNRNDMVSKYEDLVKSQSDEIDRLKKEIEKMQDALQEVKENMRTASATKSTKKTRYNVKEEIKKPKNISSDATEYTSEDDHVDNSRALNLKPKKEFLTPTKENIPVVELSGSESKRSVKSVSKEPTVTSTRKTRKKKLFTQLDESFISIDPEEVSPSPVTTRSLRNRRK